MTRSPSQTASSSTCSASRSTTARACARTVFMKGCPLCCAWCHNPESQSPSPEFVRLRHLLHELRALHRRGTRQPGRQRSRRGRRGGVPDRRAAGRGRARGAGGAGRRRCCATGSSSTNPAAASPSRAASRSMQAAFVDRGAAAAPRRRRAHGPRHVRLRAAGPTCATRPRTPSLVLYDLKLMDAGPAQGRHGRVERASSSTTSGRWPACTRTSGSASRSFPA